MYLCKLYTLSPFANRATIMSSVTSLANVRAGARLRHTFRRTRRRAIIPGGGGGGTIGIDEKKSSGADHQFYGAALRLSKARPGGREGKFDETTSVVPPAVAVRTRCDHQRYCHRCRNVHYDLLLLLVSLSLRRHQH